MQVSARSSEIQKKKKKQSQCHRGVLLSLSPLIHFLSSLCERASSRHIYIFIETQRGFACKPFASPTDGIQKTGGQFLQHYDIERK
jgi:hypothetical protein